MRTHSLEESKGHVVNENLSPISSPSRVWTDIDLDAVGRFEGYFRVPHSTHDSCYGWIPIPFVSLKSRDDGPRVLLMAGNHGDEYEGQVMLHKLARSLELEDVLGQVIILPAANYPAVRAGRRTSPVDGGNMNRMFPGDPSGSPTQVIAHFIETVLVARADYVFDFHSGGSSSEYLPLAHVIDDGNPVRSKRAREILEVFAMPISVMVEGLGDGGQGRLFGACQRAGDVVHMSTELGGGGTVSIDPLARAERGLARLLHHVGAVRRRLTEEAAPPTVFYRRPPARDFIYALWAGIFEPYVKLGDLVSAGQAAGAIHDPTAPWRPPHPVSFSDTGMVLSRRVPARVEIGDCLMNLGVPE